MPKAGRRREDQRLMVCRPLYDLKCPMCGSEELFYDDEWWSEDMVKVEYKVHCQNCNHRFTVKAAIAVYEIVNRG